MFNPDEFLMTFKGDITKWIDLRMALQDAYQLGRKESEGKLDAFTWRTIDYDNEKTLPEEDKPVLLASQYPNGVFVGEAWLVDRERGLWHLEATDRDGDHQEVWGSDAKAWMPLPEPPK